MSLGPTASDVADRIVGEGRLRYASIAGLCVGAIVALAYREISLTYLILAFTALFALALRSEDRRRMESAERTDRILWPFGWKTVHKTD
jgi:hypothetical protein